MKKLKYNIIILLSVACVAAPAFVLLYAFYEESIELGVLGGVLLPFCYLLSKPMTKWRVEARQAVEYDEFGRSKSKGQYDKLSKAERDQIDLQRTAKMERLISSSALRKMTHKGSEDPKADMAAMIGLAPVKERLGEMVARMQFDTENQRQHSENGISGRHMVFFGSPGTGKTTVAKIVTGYLYQYGYIPQNKYVEVDGNFLKAGAETATKTELLIQYSYGGVLFIDEAYALMDPRDSSGAEAIATLIKQMEDHRDRFILILAGYTKEMQILLRSNPGFSSRIKEYLNFPDYNAQEMREIFVAMASDNGFAVAPDALTSLDIRVEKERARHSFGNGRTARNILDEAIDRHAYNFANGALIEDDKFLLRGIDIRREPKYNGF